MLRFMLYYYLILANKLKIESLLLDKYAKI